MSIGIFIFFVFIASGVYIHHRGQVRYSVLRQLTSHTNILAPYNTFVYLFSGVPNTPFLSPRDFPELNILKENWEIIREEAAAAYDAGRVKTSADRDDVSFNSFFKSGWSRFYLKWYNDFHPSAIEQCPKTVELLKQTPSVNAALFALLPAGAKLNTHRDPFAGSLRYHLGLDTPNSDECFIDVDGGRYTWSDGGDVIFDETYIHSAANHSDQHRMILFCDVQRPMRGPISDAVNRWVSRFIIKTSTSRNESAEKVGALNVIFRYLYSLRVLGKRIKKWNRKVYYVLKYVVYGGLLWVIFF